jgi:hypothetical protein
MHHVASGRTRLAWEAELLISVATFAYLKPGPEEDAEDWFGING